LFVRLGAVELVRAAASGLGAAAGFLAGEELRLGVLLERRTVLLIVYPE